MGSGVPPPLSNGWQWENRCNNSFVVERKDEGTREGNACGSAKNFEIGSKYFYKLLPFEQSLEHPQSEVGYQYRDAAKEEEIEELDSDDVKSSDD